MLLWFPPDPLRRLHRRSQAPLPDSCTEMYPHCLLIISMLFSYGRKVIVETRAIYLQFMTKYTYIRISTKTIIIN